MKSYFTDDELKCKCCGKLIIDDVFLFRLNWARHVVEIPFVVSSGYRCPKHNAAEGSTSTNHTTGKAVDLSCLDHFLRYKIIAACIDAGILGIGINKTFLHVDVNRTLPSIWTNGDD